MINVEFKIFLMREVQKKFSGHQLGRRRIFIIQNGQALDGARFPPSSSENQDTKLSNAVALNRIKIPRFPHTLFKKQNQKQ